MNEKFPYSCHELGDGEICMRKKGKVIFLRAEVEKKQDVRVFPPKASTCDSVLCCVLNPIIVIHDDELKTKKEISLSYLGYLERERRYRKQFYFLAGERYFLAITPEMDLNDIGFRGDQVTYVDIWDSCEEELVIRLPHNRSYSDYSFSVVFHCSYDDSHGNIVLITSYADRIFIWRLWTDINGIIQAELQNAIRLKVLKDKDKRIKVFVWQEENLVVCIDDSKWSLGMRRIRENIDGKKILIFYGSVIDFKMLSSGVLVLVEKDRDNIVLLMGVESKKLINLFHTSSISSVQFSKDEHSCIVTCKDGVVVWKLNLVSGYKEMIK